MATKMAAQDRSSASQDRENEDFVDALDSLPQPRGFSKSAHLDLDTSIRESDLALNLFFNNKFAQAQELMQPWADKSMYHALGYGTILYIQAVMTFDMADIELAIEAIKKSVIVCNQVRKKSSFMSSLSKFASKNDYNGYTEEEIHAELCYAECLLVRACLTFIQDENLISFIKGGLKIRESYKIYKECHKILRNRKVGTDRYKVHFDSGVCMGIGTFNLMVSLLPSKIMKLMEFVGFSGKKKLGLSEIQRGCELRIGLRSKLCAIILVVYHSLITYILGSGDGDIELATETLKPCLKDHPQGALFLFFAGRLEEVKGNIDEAVNKFEDSIESQSEWRQFHHLCYWELMWCHCFKSDWLMAMKYAERLCKESRWSKATYTYQKASFLIMCSDQTEETKKHIDYLLGEVPRLKQRIAGKSLPFEKFAVAKSERYFQQGGHLTLPALELIYVWNGFNIVGKNRQLLERMLVVVESTVTELAGQSESASKDKYYYDNYSLALLIKGVCLRHRGQEFQAEQCFTEVIENEKKLVSDHYLIPYSMVELAILHLHQERFEETKKHLEKVKKQYRGYYLENRLHFRMHAIRLDLKTAMNSEGDSQSLSDTFGQDAINNHVRQDDEDLDDMFADAEDLSATMK
ncbi:tetratricopeptide repeat protein 39B-like isoform X2 [Physella acuta]|uniref:tetratricopeptide repeat protein 39B-like isoform X2 n=1 Tax=Physella acuta TaxID=109671 RepID=UPI0027DDEDD8|nr:tetratricopeptide repeat protein 39B-like isoform X2 [Physella acuta]